MADTVFWSWQDDLCPKTNRHFIRDCLAEAIKQVNNQFDIEDSDRPDIEIDHDTKGERGAVDIPETILKKIDECSVMVADITPIACSENGKSVQNPNVMIELGYGMKSVGYERIIPILNESYASVDPLPFDIRNRRTVFYELAKDTCKKEKNTVRKTLISKLVGAIKANISESQISNKNLEGISREQLAIKTRAAAAFVRERFIEIQKENGIMPIPVSKGALVMHLIPIDDFEEDRRKEIPVLSSQTNFLPIHSGGNDYVGSKGYGFYSDRNYTHIFRDGSLEAVSTSIFSRKSIAGSMLPKELTSTVNRYIKGLRDNNASTPILLKISAMNMKDIKLFLEDGCNSSCHDNTLDLPSSLINEYHDDDDYTNIIIKQMDYFWNAFGIRQCDYSPFDKYRVYPNKGT